MSLVDYASSDSDDEGTKDIPADEEKKESDALVDDQQNRRSGFLPNQQPESSSCQTKPSVLKLPDASLLLNLPATHALGGYDHSSRVAAAMAENASRKRDANGSDPANPRTKVPRGRLPYSRDIPDTVRGLLRPPQLSGRSNIVTEDISKLFVKRPADPSSN
ncbi:hypothetical protein RJ639_044503 [Escallonia herrerae]|uniref:Uncharacterized protein n=1 Tax=Escallonia herrerae TaxID=1293975 RepID=A0AA89B9U2_9ASTE|nr:hypothetical protein RJ639_044503 [Escallonia herrerae]